MGAQAPEAPPKAKCTATKANGEPCGAWATTTGKCAGHSRLGWAADPTANAKVASRVSAQARADRVELRKLSFLDLVAKRVEERAERYLEVYENAGAEGDWRAIDALVTRVHGKPIERVESTTRALDPAEMTPAERAELRRKLLADNPELADFQAKRKAATG